MYTSSGWNVSSRRQDKQRKKKNWLGPFWTSCICVPPTPGSELKKLMQKKGEELQKGGRESFPIKIIETAGKTFKQTLVNTDPFNGNECQDKKCVVSNNPNNNNNKISCRRNSISYQVTCLLCVKAGREGVMATNYYGESWKNMHCRAEEPYQNSIANPRNCKTSQHF